MVDATSPGPEVNPQEKTDNSLGTKEVSRRGFPLFPPPILPPASRKHSSPLESPSYISPDPGPGVLGRPHTQLCQLCSLLEPLSAPLQKQPTSQLSTTPVSKPLTWELVAIARSKSWVASAIGCHKVGVALNTERKNEASDSGLGSGVIFQGRWQ